MAGNRKFFKNLEKLSYAGFKTKEGTIESEFKLIESKMTRINDKINEFQNEIDRTTLKIERINRQIYHEEYYLSRIKDNDKYSVRFSERYKITKETIKRLKKQKKSLPKQLKLQYLKMKREKKILKEAEKEFKLFEKFINKTAKKYKKEIKFITYFKKHEGKLRRVYSKEQIEKIKRYMNQLRNRGSNSENIMNVDTALKQLKKAMKVQSLFNKSRAKNKQNEELIFKVELNNEQEKMTAQEEEYKNNDKIISYKEVREKFMNRINAEDVDNTLNLSKDNSEELMEKRIYRQKRMGR